MTAQVLKTIEHKAARPGDILFRRRRETWTLLTD
jgi:hypothetical protein